MSWETIEESNNFYKWLPNPGTWHHVAVCKNTFVFHTLQDSFNIAFPQLKWKHPSHELLMLKEDTCSFYLQDTFTPSQQQELSCSNSPDLWILVRKQPLVNQ